MSTLRCLWRRLTAVAPAWCDDRHPRNRAERRGAAAMLDRYI